MNIMISILTLLASVVGLTYITTKPTQHLMTQTVSHPTPTAKQTSTCLDQFNYPGSVVDVQNEYVLRLESTDDPTTIAQWYKAKFATNNIPLSTSSQSTINNFTSILLNGSQNTMSVTVHLTSRETNRTVIVVEQENCHT